MGLGLVFPILNALIMDPHGGFFTHIFNNATLNLIYGSTIAIYMLCWFFGAAFLGDLSDKIGRKKSLMFCLIGAFMGYGLSAVAVHWHSLILLLIGRIVAGFTAGSQPIAQAAIVDLSTPEQKAKNLGFIFFAMSVGFIVGPLLGGILSDNQLISWFNFATPFYFAATLSLLNIGLLQWLFKESFYKVGKVKIKFHRAIEIFISAFKHEKVRELSYVMLAFITGWSSFYSFISLFLLKVYHFSSLKIGVFMAVMGVGFCIGNTILVEFFNKKFAPKKAFVLAAVLCAIASFITVISDNAFFAWVLAIPISALAAVGYTVLLNIFSNQVDANSQGWVMGITGAIMAFGFGVDGLVVAMIANWSAKLPILIAALGLISASILMQLCYSTKKQIN